MTAYGQKVSDEARRLTYLDLGAFTANTTVTPGPRFGCPPGTTGVRITGIHLLGSGIPNDPDGVLVVNGLVNDVSEGADDTIVAAEDLETLLVAANRFYEATLAADGTEKILTLEAGDSLRFTLVSDSAAITLNPNVVVAIEWHHVPDYDDITRVQHPSEYQA